MDVIVALEKSALPDKNESSKAKTILEQTAEPNLEEFMRSVSKTLCIPNMSSLARQGAASFLGRHLTSEKPGMQLEYRRNWFAFQVDTRYEIKTNVLNALAFDESSPSAVAECIGAIARLELPRDEWPDLINVLVFNVTNANNCTLKETSLEAISHLCKNIKGRVLETKSSNILQAVLFGMKKEEESIRVKIKAATALFSSLKLLKTNFDVESERHLIMQLVCESTQSEDTDLKVAALKCLAKIVSLYYKYMEQYMGVALFSITIEAMKSEVTEVKLQGIRFWSNVCSKEATLLRKASMEVIDTDQIEINVCFFYAMGAVQYIAPILFHTLVTQDMSNCESKQNLFSAAASCLTLISLCSKDKIAILLDFVKQYIKSPEWRERNAAIVCFGAAAGGLENEELKLQIQEMLPVLMDLFLNDPSSQVKGSVAITIGEMHELISDLSDEMVRSLLKIFMQALSMEPKVAAKVCNALENLTECIFDNVSLQEEYFEPLVEKLLETVNRLDFYNSGLFDEAFSALNVLIEKTPKNCYPTVGKTMIAIMNCMKQMLEMRAQIQNRHKQTLCDVFLTQLLITVQAVLAQFELEDVPQTSDLVMAAVFEIFNNKKAKWKVLEAEILDTVAFICCKLKMKFSKYVDAFLPILLSTLKTRDIDDLILSAAVNVTNEIISSTPQSILPHCDEFVKILLDCLISNNTSPVFKPEILSTVGEITLAIGPDVEKYVDPLFTAVLQQLSQIEDEYDIGRCVNFMEKYLSKVYQNITNIEMQPVIQSQFTTMQTLKLQASEVITICDNNKLDESDFEKLISTFAENVKNVLSAKHCDQAMIDDISDVIKNTSDLELE